MALPEIIIGSKLDAKGFKQAESATDKLGKSVMNLAKTLGLAFSAAAIVNYGKSAVKASLEAQAQQDRLGRLLKITNSATAEQVEVLNQQATSLERIGVVTAGNVTQVQSQLATFDLSISTIKTLTPAILDYVVAEKGAAASASDFKSMTNGLAQALQGNFKSLTSVGFILDDVTKKTISTGTASERAAALVSVLNSTYKDFNASIRDTPAGKFQVLANEADNVKVAIGTGILDALSLLSEDKSIDGAAADMKNFGDQTAYALVGMASLIDKLKGNKLGGAILGTFGDILSNLQPFATFVKEGKAVEARRGTPAQSPGQRIAIDKAAAIQLAKQRKQDQEARAAAAKLAKTEKDRLDRLKKIAYEKNKALVLDKASAFLTQAQKLFDVEAINLAAAAMNKQTDEDKVRIRLKQEIMALEDAINAGNVEAAARLAAAISNDAVLLGQLRGDMFALSDVPNPFTEWLATLQAIAAQLAALANIPIMMGAGYSVFNAPPGSYVTGGGTAGGNLGSDVYQSTLTGQALVNKLNKNDAFATMATGGIVNKATMALIGEAGPEAVIPLDRMGQMGGTTVIVNVSGSVTTERDLVSAITQGIYNNQAAGTPITYSTAF
jgi:hypothetical protein